MSKEIVSKDNVFNEMLKLYQEFWDNYYFTSIGGLKLKTRVQFLYDKTMTMPELKAFFAHWKEEDPKMVISM